jgi:hypothetical protein
MTIFWRDWRKSGGMSMLGWLPSDSDQQSVQRPMAVPTASDGLFRRLLREAAVRLQA